MFSGGKLAKSTSLMVWIWSLKLRRDIRHGDILQAELLNGDNILYSIIDILGFYINF